MANVRFISTDGGPPNGGIPPNVFPGPYFAPTPVHEPQPAPAQAVAPANPPQAAAPVVEVRPPPSLPQPYRRRHRTTADRNGTIQQALVVAGPPPPPAPAAPAAAQPPACNPPTHTQAFPGAYVPGSTTQVLTSPDGMGYIFPAAHTTIHIIEETFPPWDRPGANIRWRAYRVPVTMTIKQLISQLCPEKGPQGQNSVSRGITECLETGGGVWIKGAQFWIGARGEEGKMKDRVGQTLSQIGWTEKRGKEALPVWLSLSVAYS